MNGYLFNKLVDMHLIYGHENGSGQRLSTSARKHSQIDAIEIIKHLQQLIID
jgi:hypothetical protein